METLRNKMVKPILDIQKKVFYILFSLAIEHEWWKCHLVVFFIGGCQSTSVKLSMSSLTSTMRRNVLGNTGV